MRTITQKSLLKCHVPGYSPHFAPDTSLTVLTLRIFFPLTLTMMSGTFIPGILFQTHTWDQLVH